MNMEQLYQEMKAALDFFGLRFSEMNLVEVSIKGNTVVFKHGGKTITLELP